VIPFPPEQPQLDLGRLERFGSRHLRIVTPTYFPEPIGTPHDALELVRWVRSLSWRAASEVNFLAQAVTARLSGRIGPTPLTLVISPGTPLVMPAARALTTGQGRVQGSGRPGRPRPAT